PNWSLLCSSRRRHTRSKRDWSSDVCSSDLGSGEKETALLGHLDVVPEGDGWSHDPYDMIEKDGYIYGRGVADDKGPTVLGLYAKIGRASCRARLEGRGAHGLRTRGDRGRD